MNQILASSPLSQKCYKIGEDEGEDASSDTHEVERSYSGYYFPNHLKFQTHNHPTTNQTLYSCTTQELH